MTTLKTMTTPTNTITQNVGSIFEIFMQVSKKSDNIKCDSSNTSESSSNSSREKNDCIWSAEEIDCLECALRTTADEEVLLTLSEKQFYIGSSALNLDEFIKTTPPSHSLRLLEDLLKSSHDEKTYNSIHSIISSLERICLAVSKKTIDISDEDKYYESIELLFSCVSVGSTMLRTNCLSEVTARKFVMSLLYPNIDHTFRFPAVYKFLSVNTHKFMKKFPAFCDELLLNLDDLIVKMNGSSKAFSSVVICKTLLYEMKQKEIAREQQRQLQSTASKHNQHTTISPTSSPRSPSLLSDCIPTSPLTTSSNDKQSSSSAKYRTVYVCGIDTSISEKALISFVAQCGELQKVRLCGDRRNATVFGFFEYKTVEGARNLVALNQTKLGNYILKILFAEKSTKDPRGTYNFLRLDRLRSTPIRDGVSIPVHGSKAQIAGPNQKNSFPVHK